MKMGRHLPRLHRSRRADRVVTRRIESTVTWRPRTVVAPHAEHVDGQEGNVKQPRIIARLSMKF